MTFCSARIRPALFHAGSTLGLSTFRGFPLAPADHASRPDLPLVPLICRRVHRSTCRHRRSDTRPFRAACLQRSVAHTEACTHLAASRSQTGTEAPAPPNARLRAGVTSRHTGLRAAETVRRRSEPCCAERHHRGSVTHKADSTLTRGSPWGRTPKRPSTTTLAQRAHSRTHRSALVKGCYTAPPGADAEATDR